MQTISRRVSRVAAMAIFALAGTATAAAAEVVIKAQTGLPRNHDLVLSFFNNFLEPLNAKAKGIVQIEYVGGPEVTPPANVGAALRRGSIEMLHSPAAYYAGVVPQAQALMASNLTIPQVREGGGFDVIRSVWSEKLNAHVLAWPERAAQYNLFFVREPKVGGPTGLDLSGFRMRSTPAYRPLLTALGATPVGIAPQEMHTSLQRGLVDGFGWPNVALKAMGVTDLVRYWVEPPFYHLANLLLVNQDRWKALPEQVRAALTEAAAQYEETSNNDIRKHQQQQIEDLKAVGAKPVRLEGADAQAYLSAAYESMWKRVGETVSPEELQAIRPRLYSE